MAEQGCGFKRISIGLVALWLGLFAIIPNILVFLASLLTRSETQFVRFEPTLENYQRLFDPALLHIFTGSLAMAFTATLICLAVGYPFAYFLSRVSKRWRTTLLVLIIIPFWTNSLIRTYALVILLNANGAVNTALLWLGLIDEPLQLLYTELAVFTGLTYTLLPFMILPLYASIEKLDRRLLEASRDLGAGPVRTFLRVSLPLTLPGIIAGSMLVFLPALSMFYIPDILGGGRSMLIGNFIKNQFLTSRDWPFGSAASVFLTMLMVLMLLAYQQSGRLLRGRAGA
jgi:spermidine/putrescine transport system permease protein